MSLSCVHDVLLATEQRQGTLIRGHVWQHLDAGAWNRLRNIWQQMCAREGGGVIGLDFLGEVSCEGEKLRKKYQKTYYFFRVSRKPLT